MQTAPTKPRIAYGWGVGILKHSPNQRRSRLVASVKTPSEMVESGGGGMQMKAPQLEASKCGPALQPSLKMLPSQASQLEAGSPLACGYMRDGHGATVEQVAVAAQSFRAGDQIQDLNKKGVGETGRW